MGDVITKEVDKNVENSESLLDSIIAKTDLTQEDESYDIVKGGLEELIKGMLKTNQGERVNKNVVDGMIAEIDKKLSKQVDAILHHEKFQEIESRWRGLHTLIEQTDFRENIKIEILNVTKEELLEDFDDNIDITQSGLYQHVYTKNYGTHGGEPIGTILADYSLSPSNADMKFLNKVAAISAMAHAPFFAAAGPKFFGLKSFEGLPKLKDLKDIMDSPTHTGWRGFRENEDAKYVGLTLPRFLLRAPYSPDDNPIKKFAYKEDVSGSHEKYLWGNTIYAFGTRLTESFAKFRWCTNIIGPNSGGTVKNLPVHTFESMGDVEMKIPTEVLISDRKEYELSELGFIPLAMRKGSNNATFFAANSAQIPKKFPDTPEGNAAELNYKLGTQMPYLFSITKMAHYIKVLQREHLGEWREKGDLSRELNKWVSQYVVNQENPPTGIRSKKPFRKGSVEVEDIPSNPGFYQVTMSLRPHLKYSGASFDLSLVGKLDKTE